MQRALERRSKDSVLMEKMALKGKNWKPSWSEKQQETEKHVKGAPLRDKII